MKQRNLIILGSVAVLGSGCGIFENARHKAKEKKEVLEIEGSWKTDCVEKGFLQTSYQQNEISFNVDNSFKKQLGKFDDSHCKSASIKTIIEGDFALLGNSSDVEGAKEINLTVRDIKVASVTDAANESLNKQSYCGKDNWQTGQETRVTGLNCFGQPLEKGDVVFDIYKKINDKELAFGSTVLGFDEVVKIHHRPKSLEDKRTYKK